jgi:hypothetical protein
MLRRGLIMTASEISQLRLINQHLTSPAFKNPADIVQYMGAIQAQDYAGAKWAIGQRLTGATDATVEKAFTDGDIIRTHVMRPTWHFVSPQDIRWMLELTAARVQGIAGTQHRQYQLNSSVFLQCEKAISSALHGGKQLMRSEVADALEQAGIATNEQRFIHIMMQMELTGLVCSGGRHGKQFTYALLDERVPKTKKISRDEALAMLAERYFIAHGPATLPDFVWWGGLTVTDAKAGREMIKDKLTSQMINGSSYWFAEQSYNLKSKTSTAFLLPNYDEFIVSYKDPSATIASSNINKADPRGTIFNNTIIVGGRIIATWKHTFKKDMVIINLIPFARLSKANDTTINTAAKRYTKFLGLKGFILLVK